MYIQPTDPKGRVDPFFIPKGYSGNAFRLPEQSEQEPQLPADSPQMPDVPAQGPSEQEMTREIENTPADGARNEEKESDPAPVSIDENAEILPTLAKGAQKEKSTPTGGLLSRIPFLSSLLPPPRKGGGVGGRLPEWVVIAAVIFLLAGDEDGGDVLPFLLLLLLWD